MIVFQGSHHISFRILAAAKLGRAICEKRSFACARLIQTKAFCGFFGYLKKRDVSTYVRYQAPLRAHRKNAFNNAPSMVRISSAAFLFRSLAVSIATAAEATRFKVVVGMKEQKTFMHKGTAHASPKPDIWDVP